MSYVPSISVIAMQLYECEQSVAERFSSFYKRPVPWGSLPPERREHYVALAEEIVGRGVLSRPILSDR